MKVIASDGKEFKRPKLARNEKGELVRNEAGNVVIEDVGFYTPLGVTVFIEDSDTFEKKFLDVWKQAKKDYNVKMLRGFASAQHIVRKELAHSYSAALGFLYAILEGVKDLIGKVHVNWVILPSKRTPTVQIGGKGSVQKPISVSVFKRNLGNIFPLLGVWSYTRQHSTDYEVSFIDNFQGKTTNAWEEVVSLSPSTVIVPKGDEVNPFICMADILAYLIDKRMYQRKAKLFKDQLIECLEDYPFDITCFYFDEKNLANIKWIDESPLQTHLYFPSHMVWLLVDDMYLEKPRNDTSRLDSVKAKEFLTEKGFVEVPLILAQLEKGGARGFHMNDSHMVKDGDYLIYMGMESEKVAKTFCYALDVKAMSVVELRKNLRKKGYETI